MDPCDDGLGRMRLARPVGSPWDVAGLPSGHTVHVIVLYAGTNESTIRIWPSAGPAIRHPVPRGSEGGPYIRHETVTDHKKLALSGFLH